MRFKIFIFSFLIIPSLALGDVHFIREGHTFLRVILEGTVDQHSNCIRAPRTIPLVTNLGIHYDPRCPGEDFARQICLVIKNTQMDKIRAVLESTQSSRKSNGLVYFISGTYEYGSPGECQITSWSETSFKIIINYADRIYYHSKDERNPSTSPLFSYYLKGTLECLSDSVYKWRCLFLDDQSSAWDEEIPGDKRAPYDGAWKIDVLKKLEEEVSKRL
ncbi:MAG: hypothetical protein HQK50_11365 [Oligoflexia bacterium]|nr:hypothetical protein [Oligoflexia bacterium]MBF0366163.1 hypothetical protein [Oligoflexia bacterium]